MLMGFITFTNDSIYITLQVTIHTGNLLYFPGKNTFIMKNEILLQSSALSGECIMGVQY